MLFIDTDLLEVITICATSFIGICGVSAGLEGFLLKPMNPLQRLLSAAGGLLLIVPGIVTDVMGLALVGAVAAMQIMEKKKAKV